LKGIQVNKIIFLLIFTLEKMAEIVVSAYILEHLPETQNGKRNEEIL